MNDLTFRDCVVVDASPETVYATVSDITRTGEWSQVCRRAEWVDPTRTGAGAQFLGHNDDGTKQWTTTSTVVAARPGEEFGWEVGKSYVHWAYLMRPSADGAGTELTHTWEVLPALRPMFAEKYGDDADALLAHRVASARRSIPLTLAAIKEIVGKRVFRMAPLHHHFELIGWAEVTIVARFWIVAGICVAIGLALFYGQWVVNL